MSPMRFSLSPRSDNGKTGPIAVSRTEAASCPPSCAFYRTICYAEGVRVRKPWLKVATDGRNLAGFLVELAAAALSTTRWRHNEAGDLPGEGEDVDVDAVRALDRAAAAFRWAWTYTHKRPADVPATTNLVVNLSGNSPAHAVRLMRENPGRPVVAATRIDAPRKETIDGVACVRCPAVGDIVGWKNKITPIRKETGVTCAGCGGERGPLCARSDRPYIVTFPTHGIRAARYNADNYK